MVRIAAPQDEGLSSVAQIAKGQVERGRDIVVNVNNHYEGCAVMTIDRLVERMGYRPDAVLSRVE